MLATGRPPGIVARRVPHFADDAAPRRGPRSHRARVEQFRLGPFERSRPAARRRRERSVALTICVDEVLLAGLEGIATGERSDERDLVPWRVERSTKSVSHPDAEALPAHTRRPLDGRDSSDEHRVGAPIVCWRAATGTAGGASTGIGRTHAAGPEEKEERHKPDAAHACLDTGALREFSAPTPSTPAGGSDGPPAVPGRGSPQPRRARGSRRRSRRSRRRAG